MTEADAPALLAVLRFVQDTPGAEALGIGLAAAYLQAAPARTLAGAEGAQAFDALGGFADRLARRASAAAPGKASGATLSAHLDVANGYGLRFATYEVESRMQVCYEGEFFRRVLAMPAADAPQRARAALALTRPECVDPDLPAHERARLYAWQADVLERVDVTGLPPYLRGRVQMRRASVWGALAFQQARKSMADPAVAASAARALAEFTGVSKSELPDEDQSAYNDAAMRVSAVRWALAPVAAAAPAAGARPTLLTEPGAAGETCVLLVDAQHGAKAPLLRRCTYGLVWAASASTNREGTAVALAVQPLEGWRELWVLRKTEGGWLADVLPRRHRAGDRRGRMGGLGAWRPADAGGARGPWPGPLPQELRSGAAGRPGHRARDRRCVRPAAVPALAGPGLEAPVPEPALKQKACTGGVQARLQRCLERCQATPLGTPYSPSSGAGRRIKRRFYE